LVRFWDALCLFLDTPQLAAVEINAVSALRVCNVLTTRVLRLF
jgi:hypothetical protein